MRYWHLTFSTRQRMPLVADEAGRRRLVWAVARAARGRVLLFCIVDDHVHVVVACPADRIGDVCRGFWRALSAAVAEELDPAHRRPVESRAHLIRLVRYLLTQTSRHGLQAHPALYSGSCFLDLVGARQLGPFRPRILEALPRVRREELCAIVGLPSDAIVPAVTERVRRAGATRIAQAAASAAAAIPTLRGRTVPLMQARHAAAHLGCRAGISTNDLAWALGVTPRGVRHMLARPAHADLVRAVSVRLSLEDAVDAGAVLLRGAS